MYYAILFSKFLDATALSLSLCYLFWPCMLNKNRSCYFASHSMNTIPRCAKALSTADYSDQVIRMHSFIERLTVKKIYADFVLIV